MVYGLCLKAESMIIASTMLYQMNENVKFMFFMNLKYIQCTKPF